MTSPVLHLLAGPNGAGKSAFVRDVLRPVTHLRFINADEIAAERWPGRESEHGYEASTAATAERDDALNNGVSFITETVFSHPSKVELVRQAMAAGYLVTLHVILVPQDVSVLRVKFRVAQGGHAVPETKIRERYKRLWPLVAEARDRADRTIFYDNGSAREPFRVVATYENGLLVGQPLWPTWAPDELTSRQ